MCDREVEVGGERKKREKTGRKGGRGGVIEREGSRTIIKTSQKGRTGHSHRVRQVGGKGG